jgi:hypothetical protein
MQISIDELKISNNRIYFPLHISRSLKPYLLNDNCYVQYDINLDLRQIDNSILYIPVIAAMTPIAWATGADINVPKLDAAYLRALTDVKDVFRDSYSNFSFSGDIYAGEAVTNRYGNKRVGMLFSGGVDSLTSYLRHRDKTPDLFSIWGVPDIPPFENKFWGRMWTEISEFADRNRLSAFQIKTDLYRNTNRELLRREFGLSWWGDVTAGLFMLGMCAPLTVTRDIGTVIIASSYTQDFKKGLGFHPSIDNSISWADVTVRHDGYDLSRQQKLHYLCRNETMHNLSNLRVCWDSAGRTNCGSCEKCFRTIVGLIVEGADPNNCNFDINTKTLPYIRDCFYKGKIALSEGAEFMWRDIQKHIPERIDTDIYGSREFLTWLRGYDLSRYRINKLRKFSWQLYHFYRNRRVTAPAIIRKIRCYYYVLLNNLRKRYTV